MAEKQTLAQDSYRETQLANHLGLTLNEARMGNDATDEFGNPFELKCSTKSNKYVSTARDLTIERVETVWMKQYWCISTGKEFSDSASKRYEPYQVWLAHPDFLAEAFEAILKPLRVRVKIEQYIRDAMKGDVFLQTHHNEVEKLFKRGKTLNDPKLNVSAFRHGGISIDLHDKERAVMQRLEYVSKYPLKKAIMLNDTFDKFFTIT